MNQHIVYYTVSIECRPIPPPSIKNAKAVSDAYESRRLEYSLLERFASSSYVTPREARLGIPGLGIMERC